MTRASDPLRFPVPEEMHHARLDRAVTLLCAGLADLSRTRVKELILSGAVSMDGEPVHDPAHRVAAGRVIAVQIPETIPADLAPEAIALNVVYEDEHLLVIDKPPGLVVHPGAGHGSGTLVHALLNHCGGSLSGIGGVARPGIVHRLDRFTSGLMIVAKTDTAHRHLAAQLSDRTLSRTYRAVVCGEPSPPSGWIETTIGRHPTHRLKMAAGVREGRTAVTRYCTVSSFGKSWGAKVACSLVECMLETGRTHQIRVHMAHIRTPVVGDPFYGPQPTALGSALRKAGYDPEVVEVVCAFPRQALHAMSLGFVHPATGRPMRFDVPLPSDMQRLIDALVENSVEGPAAPPAPDG
ncbi:MAG TPA: RluA family pseudouridine synthase [Alphaproteobacteria bacterium]|nr:RluA family pseudouridine synthase [Alphaproteobacteria bacterium]